VGASGGCESALARWQNGWVRRMVCGVGILYYGGSATPIPIEDRALAHLKVVIATKLRRSESFTLSWVHPEDQPRGRSTIWLHPSIPLRFVFNDPEPTTLNPQWVKELANSANSSGGITLTAEYLDDAEPDPTERRSTPLPVGKVEVDELTIDALTVAGTRVAPHDAGLSVGGPSEVSAGRPG
jgi:hypothetical protein